ncbi:MAG: polysaccharide biosynthesis/export family protein [Gammaproteobacteria bacterium]
MQKIITSIILIMRVALIAAACGSCSPMRGAVPLPDAGPYRLDSGDRLRVVVFGQEDISGEYAVDGSGFISIPLINQVQARGRTVTDLEKEIAQRLQLGNLLVNASISVQVAQFRPFFILGEVRQPGQFPYVEGMTVLTAVAIAGGFTYRAETDYYTITRTVEGKVVEARGEKTTVVQPGDVILVSERYF